MTGINVELLNHMGDDLMVANCARVSFGKWRDEFVYGEHMGADERLIKSLAREGHWSPFSHPKIQMRFTAPIFLVRQLQKHMIGGQWGHEVTDWSEESRRYVDEEPEFWVPGSWRSRAKDKKQGSGEPLPDQKEVNDLYDDLVNHCSGIYKEMIGMGVAPEQARSVLPQSTLTQWIWTGSLAFWARVCHLRLDNHAQVEARQVAKMINDICAELFPISWAALMNPNSRGYFVESDGGGFEVFETRTEAADRAREQLESEYKEMDDGEFPDTIEYIRWGEILGQSTFEPSKDDPSSGEYRIK